LSAGHPSANEQPASVAGQTVLTGFTPQDLTFIVGKHLAMYRGEHYIKTLFPTVTELTVLLFARSGLYADRGSRPGLRSIVSGLFQVTVVALAFALVNGEEFASYYIFYGSLIFAIAIVSLLRWSYEWLTGVILRAAGYDHALQFDDAEAFAAALADLQDAIEELRRLLDEYERKLP